MNLYPSVCDIHPSHFFSFQRMQKKERDKKTNPNDDPPNACSPFHIVLFVPCQSVAPKLPSSLAENASNWMYVIVSCREKERNGKMCSSLYNRDSEHKDLRHMCMPTVDLVGKSGGEELYSSAM